MFIVFDIETTGFNRSTDDVIQFAYIAFDKGHAIRSDVLYFYHDDMAWSEEAYAVHQISQDFLRKYREDFNKNLIKIFTVLSGANVCGFNSDSFDCPFVTQWLSRQGLSGLEFRVTQDVMVAYRPIMKRRMFKLTALTEQMGVTTEVVQNMARMWFKENAGDRAHDASYDVTATALFTLQGVNKGLISFSDTPEKIKEVAAAVPQEALVATGNGKMRDPNTKLVYLGDKPYLLNSNKSVYATDDPLPYEISALTEAKKYVKTPFQPNGIDTWTTTEGNFQYVIKITDELDELWLVLPTKRVKAF